MSAAAALAAALVAALAAACREDLEGHLAGQQGRDSCSMDPARSAGKLDQVGTIPEEGIPCHIHQVQEGVQVQVGPSLVQVGKEKTYWGFGIQVRQVGREDRSGQEVGWRQVPALDEHEPRN